MSLKTVFFSVFSIAIALFVISCLEPPSLGDFFSDPDVRGVIDRDRIRMIDLTGDGLRIGNGRITGLNPNKYYWVEMTVKEVEISEEPVEPEVPEIPVTPELDPNIKIKKANIMADVVPPPPADPGTTKYFRFVAGDGKLIKDPLKINRVSGRTITGLTNYYTQNETQDVNIYTTYTIRAAAAAPTKNLVYYVIEKGETLDPEEPPEDSKEFKPPLPTPVDESSYYLDFTGAISSEESELAILKIMVIPSADPVLIPANRILGDSFFKLEGEGTTTDYIFIECDSEAYDAENNEFTIVSFRVLRVAVSGEVPEKLEEREIVLNVDISDLGESFILNDDEQLVVKQSDLNGSGVTITLVCSEQGFDETSVIWWYDGEKVTTSVPNILIISETDNPYYMVEGKHHFTVEAKINDSIFTKTFTVEVELDE